MPTKKANLRGLAFLVQNCTNTLKTNRNHHFCKVLQPIPERQIKLNRWIYHHFYKVLQRARLSTSFN